MNPDDNNWERLCGLTEEQMRTHRIPGVSLGVLFGGETVCGGFGVTNLDNPLPVEPSTLFQIGSISKTFTCAVVMRLIEGQRLQLHSPLLDLLPTWRVADAEATSRATVWNLLTHTGGWMGDLFIDTGPGEEALADYASRMAELPQVVPIGLHYSYNNAGFALLGHMVEITERKPFEKVVSESIFEPAGLVNCFFNADDVMARRFAVGHRVVADLAEVATPWALPRSTSPMGGIIANVPDLLSYARLMLDAGRTRGGAQLLTVETIKAMQTPQMTIWRDREAIGLAWHIERHDGHTLLHHTGATLGQAAYLEYCPARAFALAILANSDTAPHMIRSIRRQALRDYLGVLLPEDKHLPLATQQMKEVEGRYVLPKLGYTEIRILAGRLIGQDINIGGFPTEDTPPEPSPPPYTLQLSDTDRLVIADGKYKDTTCDILRDETGQMRWFRMGGRIYLRESIPQY